MRAGVTRSVRTTKYSPFGVSSSWLSLLSRVAKAACTSSAAAGPITTCLPDGILAAGIDALDGPDLEAESWAAATIDWVLLERALEVGDQLDQQVGRELRLEVLLDLVLDLARTASPCRPRSC